MTFTPSANPLRMAASIESGTGPLETVLRIDGIPSGTTPDIGFTGPGPVEFIECIDPTSCKVRMTTEGIYTFTVTSRGYDGNTYSDKIAVTVVDKAKLDALLKGKWEGMKAALIAENIEEALTYFAADVKNRYRASFTSLSHAISNITVNMLPIEFVYLRESIAKYRIQRSQVIDGRMTTLTYYVYFSRNNDGAWKIEQF